MEEFPCTSSPYTQKQHYGFIRWKSGKRFGPRPLSILESFEDLYTNQKDFLKKLFDGKHEELFNKTAIARKKKKTKKMKTMTRSMSMHDICNRGFDDEINGGGGVKLERFKVRRPSVIVTGQDNGGGNSGGLAIEGQATN